MSNVIEVDLGAKKPEAEWIRSMDAFWLEATPELYKWLGWTTALAGLDYLARTQNSPLFRALSGTFFILMINYLNAYFFKFVFLNPPFVKTPGARRLASIILSGVLSLASALLAMTVSGMIARMKS